MKAIAVTKSCQAELIDWPFDEAPPKPNEVVGRTLVTLTSPGTELNAYTQAERPQPYVGGYSAIFQIDAVGAEVTTLRPGQHVFAMGKHQSRLRFQLPAPVPVPEGLAPEVAVFSRLMAVSWTTLTTTTARPAERVLVTGLGPVGNLAAQIFQAAGYNVTAVDPVEARRQVALRAGLRDVRPAVPLDDTAIAGSFALAVDCSGHEQAVLDGCKMVRRRGEVVLVGVPWKRRSDMFAHDLLHAVFHRYIVLRSGWEWELPREYREFAPGSIYNNLAFAMDWLRQGRVKVDGLYRLADPAECQPVWQDLLNQRGPLAVVFDWSKV